MKSEELFTEQRLFRCSVNIKNIGLVAEGLDDLIHFLTGMNIQGQAEGGNAGLVIALDRGGTDGNPVFPDDGGDFTEHIHPVIGQDGDGGITILN